jgi:hypothetical protein
MANRTGIELLPYVCRIVEVQAGGGLFGRGKARGASRVRNFREIPYSPGSPGLLAAELRQIKGLERRASVAVWGLKSRHEAFLLPPAAPADLEIVARREAKAGSGPGSPDQIADGIMIGELREAGRREVGYVSVQPDEMRGRLQPLVDAGFVIERAVTPAVAHAIMVRQRWASFPDAVTAVLAVNARVTALTIMRGSIVLFARELPWGHETERGEQADATLDSSRFAANLASELRRSFVYVNQSSKVDVTHVLVCGDVPNMRSLTGPLMSELSVEVETLDAIEDVDLTRIPDSADDFRDRAAALRVAWALAGDTSWPVNLVPRSTKPGGVVPRLERRHAYAAMAGVIIAAAVWGLVWWLGSGATADQDRLRRQIAVLDPEMARLGEARRNAEVAAARLAALRAFASQGPRFAKVLEVFSRATPDTISLTELKIEPAVGAWTLTVSGQAEGPNAAAAQITFNHFLSALKESPLLGEPLKPPSTSVRPGDPAPERRTVLADLNERRYLPELLEPTRRAYAGPAYREIARDGRIYRLPIRQQASADYLDEEERRRRRNVEDARLGREEVVREEKPEDAGKRYPATLLEFTVTYEVRK